MNYKKIYLDLINKRVNDPAKLYFDYTQNHHIKPVSIYPQYAKNKENIVNLSAREHFIAHILLVKYYKQINNTINYGKMLAAFAAMSTVWGSNVSSKLRYKCGYRKSYLYEKWKKELSRVIKETGCRAGIYSSCYGKILIHNDQTHEQKLITKDEEIPQGWQLGTGKWNIRKGAKSGAYNYVWCYNIKTNEQYYIKKNQINNILKNKDIKLGVNPNSKTHLQQYNPLNFNIWISNLELKEFKLWPKNQDIPEGWLRGKLDDFDSYLYKYKLAQQKEYATFINFVKDMKEKSLPKIRLKVKVQRLFHLNKDKKTLKELIDELELQKKIKK